MRAAFLLLTISLTFGAGATASCSSHTTTTTRTVERPADSGSEAADQRETTVTETKESTASGPHVGILSGTIHAIGFILALPFKIIGGLLTVIF